MKKKKNYAIWWVLLIAFWSWNFSLYANGHYIYGTLLLIADVVVSAIVILSIKSAKQADKKKAEGEERRQRWGAETEELRRRQEERARAAAEARRAKEAAFLAELKAIPRAQIMAKRDDSAPEFPEYRGTFTPANVTRSTNVNKIFPLVVLDLETTGLSSVDDEIIELAAIKYDRGFVPVSRYSLLLKPRGEIPPEASEKNHITADMVANSVYFSQIKDNFEEYIKDCNVCGHNIAKFDLRFLANNGLVIPDTVRVFDTWRIATYHYDTRRGLTLERLCSDFGIVRPEAHRALSDCLATAKVFQRLVELRTE